MQCSGFLYLSSINALPAPSSLIRLPELPTEKVTSSRLKGGVKKFDFVQKGVLENNVNMYQNDFHFTPDLMSSNIEPPPAATFSEIVDFSQPPVAPPLVVPAPAPAPVPHSASVLRPSPVLPPPIVRRYSFVPSPRD